MLGKRKITEQQCIHVLTQVVTCNQFGMNLASTKTKDTSNKSSKIHVSQQKNNGMGETTNNKRPSKTSNSYFTSVLMCLQVKQYFNY